jgi:hypothetical protein
MTMAPDFGYLWTSPAEFRRTTGCYHCCAFIDLIDIKPAPSASAPERWFIRLLSLAPPPDASRGPARESTAHRVAWAAVKRKYQKSG